MDFIVYAFIWIYLPKYIQHSVNLYDLGNSPVAHNIVQNSHWKFYIYLLFQFSKNI